MFVPSEDGAEETPADVSTMVDFIEKKSAPGSPGPSPMD
jgi:hypothetical protein